MNIVLSHYVMINQLLLKTKYTHRKREKHDQPRNFEDRDGAVSGGFLGGNVYERDIMEIVKDYAP